MTQLIAEIGQAHEGSMGLAFSYIDAIAESGCDMCKFQVHIARYESSHDEKFRVPLTSQDPSRYEYWKRMEFTKKQWSELIRHAKSLGLLTVVSSFSREGFEVVRDEPVDFWKVGSAEAFDLNVLKTLVPMDRPLIVSTGMSYESEISEVCNYLMDLNVDHSILHCVSKYPSRIDEYGLSYIEKLKTKLCCPIGLSDHSGDIDVAIYAISRDVALLEFHVVFDKRMFGPDSKASLTFDEVKYASEMRDKFLAFDNSFFDRDLMTDSLYEMRENFGRSIYTQKFLEAGTIIGADDLSLRKPAGGLPAEVYTTLLGKRLKRSVAAGKKLTLDDF